MSDRDERGGFGISRAGLVALFAGFMVAGIGIGLLGLPDSWPLVQRLFLGAMLGGGSALILFANRVID